MSTVAIDATGSLVIDGQTVFPIGLSEAPPQGGTTRDGRDAWAEVASAGANFVRTGLREWTLQQIDNQIAAERAPRVGRTSVPTRRPGAVFLRRDLPVRERGFAQSTRITRS